MAVLAHGSASVTGVAVAAGRVCSCGADGGIARWNAETGGRHHPDCRAVLESTCSARTCMPVWPPGLLNKRRVWRLPGFIRVVCSGCIAGPTEWGGDAAAGSAEPATSPSSAIQLASSSAAGSGSWPTAGATGLALSPGGLFAAVVRTALGVPAARCAKPA